MKAINRRLHKLEEGLGLTPETEADRRLGARMEAARARLEAWGYQVPDSVEGELRCMSLTEILQRGLNRTHDGEKQLECDLDAPDKNGGSTRPG
jgi:hypothetical protein